MRTECAVCQTFWNHDDLNANYRGKLECPDCGTELANNRSHDGAVDRDTFKHKK